jgi:hypothetical protein
MAYSKAIIHYTSNSEDPVFAEKLRNVIIENSGGLPIVSISQKPIDFGANLCVGDIGNSYENEFKQMSIAAHLTLTDYLIFTEADFLYPPEYFQFEPTGDDVYRYNNVWIVFNRSNAYYRKDYSNGAMICKRSFVCEKLEKMFKENLPWADWKPYTMFGGEQPCLSFKTGRGVRPKSGWLDGEENRKNTLPYWGDAKTLKRKYLYD